MEMETKNYKVDQLTANPLMDIKSVPGVTWSKPELQMEYSLAPMNASKPRDVDLILSNELLIATQMIIHEENEQ
jgi:hypothetical protein